MKRRDFMMLVGGAAASLAVRRACTGVDAAIGVLGTIAASYAPFAAAFREVLRTGFCRRPKPSIEYRGRRADLIACRRWPTTGSSPAIRDRRLHDACGRRGQGGDFVKIPVVFTTIGDPVRIGLVSSLSRPDGNVTGVTSLNVQVGPERPQVDARTAAGGAGAWRCSSIPPASHDGIPIAGDAGGGEYARAEASCAASEPEGDFGGVFSSLHHYAYRRAGDRRRHSFLRGERSARRDGAAERGARDLPRAAPLPQPGGIMDYGGDYEEPNRLAGVYTGRILKGEKPGGLPVQQASKVRLIVNLKTAKALGVTVPVLLLGRADQVIE